MTGESCSSDLRKKRKITSTMAEGGEMSSGSTTDVFRMEERPEHGMKVLQGLNKLKQDGVLCDVTLIAEGEMLILSDLLPFFHVFVQFMFNI